MAIALATLGGSDLPIQFSYRPAVPVKRSNVVQTVNTVVKRVSSEIVQSDSLIEWSCPGACETDWLFFLNLWNDISDPTLAFVGYWGDSMTVKFETFDSPSVRHRFFDLSGSFLVVAVTTWATGETP